MFVLIGKYRIDWCKNSMQIIFLPWCAEVTGHTAGGSSGWMTYIDSNNNNNMATLSVTPVPPRPVGNVPHLLPGFGIG